MNYYDLARQLHISFGSVALLAFWTTAALRKGTSTHRLIGRIYLLTILGVMVTAVPLAIHAFAVGHTLYGIFLVYLLLITGTAVGIAWRAIRLRASLTSYLGGFYRPLAWLNLLTGITVLASGVKTGSALLIGMSAIGLLVGYQMLRFAARPSQEARWWIKRHYLGIVGSGVATHIAFLNLGLSHLVPASFAAAILYVSWFGPVLAGFAAVWFLNRKYGRGISRVTA